MNQIIAERTTRQTFSIRPHLFKTWGFAFCSDISKVSKSGKVSSKNHNKMFISIGDSVVCGRYQFMLAGPRFSATANRCANDISTPFSGFPIFQTFPELGIEFPRFGITIFLNSGPGKSHFQGSESWKISYSELGKSNSEFGIRNSKLGNSWK